MVCTEYHAAQQLRGSILRVKARLERVQKDKKVTTQVIDAAVVLAAGTALTYAVAFCYEAGYCNYFAIPLFLIVPTTSVVLGAVIGVVAAGYTLIQLMALERALLADAKLSPLFRFRLEMFALMTFSGYAAFGLAWSTLLASIYAVIVFFGQYFPSLLFGKGTLIERLNAAESERDYVAESSPLTDVARFSPLVLNCFIGTTIACVVAGAIGAANARWQKDFYVIASRPDVALVKSYGDLMIGIRYDENKKAATGEVLVFKIDHDFRQVNLSKRRIGAIAGTDRQFLVLRDER